MKKNTLLLVLLVVLLVLFYFFSLVGCKAGVGPAAPTPTKTPGPALPTVTPTLSPPLLVIENLKFDPEVGIATVRIQFGNITCVRELRVGQEVIIEAEWCGEIMRVHLRLEENGVLQYRREENQGQPADYQALQL